MHLFASYASLVHGSEDSEDLDVVHFFHTKPSLRECQEFCAQTDENRNIAVIQNGIVVECFKGLPDEVNNALLITAPLHPQKHPNPVQRPVLRHVPLKGTRAARLMLTRLTRSRFRAAYKPALRSMDLRVMLKTLRESAWTLLEQPPNALKTLAFQLGQSMALFEGHELYTKQAISTHFEDLRPFLYRRSEKKDLLALEARKNEFVKALSDLHIAVEGSQHTFDTSTPHRNLLHQQAPGFALDARAERTLAWPPSNRCLLTGNVPQENP